MINFPGIIVSAISGIPDQYIEWNKEENIMGTVLNEKVESALRRMELMEDYTYRLSIKLINSDVMLAVSSEKLAESCEKVAEMYDKQADRERRRADLARKQAKVYIELADLVRQLAESEKAGGDQEKVKLLDEQYELKTNEMKSLEAEFKKYDDPEQE